MSTPLKDSHDGTESAFPALKHRPGSAHPPPAPKTLAGVRAALQRNPDVNLPDDAAGVVTAGLVDQHRFRLQTEQHAVEDGTTGSLLDSKRVGEGHAFVTPQHPRFLEMGIVPDVAGARWSHTLHNRLDVTTGAYPAARFDTALGPAGPWAMLELAVRDHDEWAGRIREAFVKTGPDNSTAGNDYTDSILQSGVKEPLLLILLRVTFGDGSADEFYLTTVDGNSRLVSAWKARTGGNVDQAATACIEAVVGQPAGRSWRRATQRQTRERLTATAAHINKGLREQDLTESTIREGQTHTVPGVVVVGGRSNSGGPLTDMLATREDLIATIHTDNTPWDLPAKSEQGMARVMRRGVKQGLLTEGERRVVEGHCTPEEMHELLGLPPHRLWAAALTLRVVLNPWYRGMRQLFQEEFNIKQARRTVVGKLIATTALSGYRSSNTLGLAANAFADGGPMSAQVWDHAWDLTQGRSPKAVLDRLLASATAPDRDHGAVIELCVLGGTAGMLEGLITRDRGSKEAADGKRAAGLVPYRTKPYQLVEDLARTEGGLRTLHSMAVAHLIGAQAKRFHTEDDPASGVHDGDRAIDAAGVQADLSLEWDVVCAADPGRAREAIAAKSVDREDKPDGKPDGVRLREELQAGTRTVVKAVRAMVTMSDSVGSDVFGSYEAVSMIKESLQEVRDLLAFHGPRRPVVIDDQPDVDEDEDEAFVVGQS